MEKNIKAVIRLKKFYSVTIVDNDITLKVFRNRVSNHFMVYNRRDFNYDQAAIEFNKTLSGKAYL